MGEFISEGMIKIAQISDEGYVFYLDEGGEHTAKITDDGYITKVGGYGLIGKIDEDGTIRDSSNSVVGRIAANGYVYNNLERIGKVSSAFTERITPKAWNGGEVSTYYEGRQKRKSRRAMTTAIVEAGLIGLPCLLALLLN